MASLFGRKISFPKVSQIAGFALIAVGTYLGNPYLISAGAGLSYGGARAQAKKEARRARRAEYSRAIKGNYSGASEHHLLVFGEVRVGGMLTAMGVGSTGGDTNDLLHIGVAHSVCHGGGVQGIQGVYIDETYTALDGSGYATDTKFISGSKKMVRATHYTGLATQAADPVLLAANIDEPNAYRRGIAWTRFDILRTNDEKFSKAFSGIPTCAVVLRGIKCYDPRLDSTNGGSGTHRLITPTTWEWTTNPALCASTYAVMSKSDGGMGREPARILWSSVAAAANVCDETISAPSGTIKRFECNGVLRTEDSRETNHEVLLESMAGYCVEAGGLFKYYAGAYRSPTVTIDASWLRDGSGVSFSSRTALTAIYNAVRVSFDDASDKWTSKEAPAIVNSTFEAQDGNDRIWRDVSLESVSNSYQAQYIGQIESRRSRFGGTGEVALNFRGLDIEPLETFILDIPEVPGLSGRVMRVTEWKWEATGPVISFEEEASSIYTVGTFIVPNSAGAPTPAQQVPTAPTGFAIIGVADGCTLTWDLPAEPLLVESAIIERSSAELTGYTDLRSVSSQTTTLHDSFVTGATFYYRLRFKSKFGLFSGYSATISSTGRIVNGGFGANLIKKYTFGDGTSGSWAPGATSESTIASLGFSRYLKITQRDTLELDNEFAVTPGLMYVEGWANTQLTTYATKMGIVGYDVSGAVVGYYGSADLLPGQGWTRVTGSFLVPAGVVRAKPWLYIDGTTGLGAVGWAELSLSFYERGATVGAPNGTNVGGVSAAIVGAVATNFNTRNDRLATAVPAPTILATGVAVDHVVKVNASVDISFEWLWSGSNADIDGFEIFVYESGSNTAYTFGTSPDLEAAYTVPSQVRAFFLFGVTPNRYYTFGVRAYRTVDPDINAAGVIRSAIVKPSLAAENPYQPSSNVAFLGDVTGTINGVPASDIAAGYLAGADTTPPTAVTGLTVSGAVQAASLYTHSRITATWDASTDASGVVNYELEYFRTVDPTRKTVILTSLLTHTIIPVTPGFQYSFRIRAYDPRGNNSAWSTPVLYTTAGDTTAPSAPTSVTATAGLDKVIVRWTNPTDADFLQVTVHRGTTAGFTANAGSRIGTTRGDTFIDSAAVAGTNYYYKIIALDVTGNASTASAAAGPATPDKMAVGNISQYMEDFTIPNAKIADGAINADKIAANAITASKILVTDFENLVSASDGFTNPNTLMWNTNPTFVTGVTYWNANGIASNNSLQITQRDNQYDLGKSIACTPGDQFYTSFNSITFSGGAGTYSLALGAIIFDRTGAVISFQYGATRAAGISGAQFTEGSFNMPGGSAYFKPFLLLDSPGGTGSGNAAYNVTKMQFRRKNTGRLIVDGTIQTNHITVGSIDGDRITINTLDGDRITANTITGNEIIGTTLSAITADMGSLTAGTITGAIIRSAGSTSRVEINGAGIFGVNASAQNTFGIISGTGEGYLGLNPGTIRWNALGQVTVEGTITGTGLIQGPVLKSRGNAGRAITIDANDEITYKDSGGVEIATIGIRTGGVDNSVAFFGSQVSGNEASNKVGVSARSYANQAIVAYSTLNSAIYAESGSGAGTVSTIYALNNALGPAIEGRSSSDVGVYGSGAYGGDFRQNVATAGGSILLRAASKVTTPPSHTAKVGTVAVRFYGSGAGGTVPLLAAYMQVGGDFNGSDNNWVRFV